MMNELDVSELRFLVRSSATNGDDVVGRGMRENMRAIRKRDMRLWSIDAMGDRWMREQYMWNERKGNGSWFLGHSGILRERGGGKEGDSVYG